MGRQQLPRAAAMASLVAAPLLGLVAACTWPQLRTGERAQIAAIAAQPDRWYIFSLFIFGPSPPPQSPPGRQPTAY